MAWFRCRQPTRPTSRKINHSIPVAGASKSLALFQALGFAHRPEFAGDDAACIVVSEATTVMLISRERFAEFSPKAICDTSKSVEALFAVTCESRAQVDDMIAKARAVGGTVHEESVDYGFVYHASSADLDGRLWGFNYMINPPSQS